MTFRRAMILAIRKARKDRRIDLRDAIELRMGLFLFPEEIERFATTAAMQKGLALAPPKDFSGWIEILIQLLPLILEFIQEILDIFNTD